MLLLQPMDIIIYFTYMDILPLLTNKGQNVWSGKMSGYRQLASYWLAKNCLEEESLSKSSKFFCPSDKVHTVTTSEFQPARLVLTNHRMSLPYVLAHSLVISAPICMLRYHGPWYNMTWEMPNRWLCYMYCIFIWESYMYVTSEKLD